MVFALRVLRSAWFFPSDRSAFVLPAKQKRELRPQFGGEAQRAKISFPREMAFAQKSSLATDVDGYRVRPAGKRKSSNSTTEA